MNVISRMNKPLSRFTLLLILLALPAATHAVELTGRLSVLGGGAWGGVGDFGYASSGSKPLLFDQESIRLMLDDTGEVGEWSVHFRTIRQNFIRYPATSQYAVDLFRSDKLSGNWQNYQSNSRTTRIRYEFDRAFYKFRSQNMTFALGRQSIDWGSGRLWQPFNVFGAFAPTDLDTDYKPGIDAATLEWFPSAFSSLSMVYVPALNRTLVSAASGAVFFRSQVGDASEVGLLGGRVLGANVGGASFESDFMGIGWRFEGLYTTAWRSSLFWVAGIDYRFEEGTTIAIEWYENSAGAVRESQLATIANERSVQYGLQQHMGRHVLGIAATRDITPLLSGSYTMLGSGLTNRTNGTSFSLLHQASLTYSVSNESDLLFSLLLASGKGLDPLSVPQSEFGHIPASATLRYRIYL